MSKYYTIPLLALTESANPEKSIIEAQALVRLLNVCHVMEAENVETAPVERQELTPEQEEIANQLFVKHQGLVHYFTDKFSNIPNTSRDSIENQARQALWRAAKVFTLKHKGAGDFADYASMIIRRELARLFNQEVKVQKTFMTTLDEPAGTPAGDVDRDDVLPDEGKVAQDVEVDPSAMVANQEIIDLVRSSVGKLPERERDALMRWAMGQTYQQIADDFGVSKKRAWDIVLSGLGKLRKEMSDKGLYADDVRITPRKEQTFYKPEEEAEIEAEAEKLLKTQAEEA